jgi:hypothetical protein
MAERYVYIDDTFFNGSVREHEADVADASAKLLDEFVLIVESAIQKWKAPLQRTISTSLWTLCTSTKPFTYQNAANCSMGSKIFKSSQYLIIDFSVTKSLGQRSGIGPTTGAPLPTRQSLSRFEGTQNKYILDLLKI